MEKKQDREGLGLAAGASGCVYVWVGCVFRGERLEDFRQRVVTHHCKTREFVTAEIAFYSHVSRKILHFMLAPPEFTKVAVTMVN